MNAMTAAWHQPHMALLHLTRFLRNMGETNKTLRHLFARKMIIVIVSSEHADGSPSVLSMEGS